MQQDKDKIAWESMDAMFAVLVLFILLLFLIATLLKMSHQLKQIETCILLTGLKISGIKMYFS